MLFISYFFLQNDFGNVRYVAGKKSKNVKGINICLPDKWLWNGGIFYI